MKSTTQIAILMLGFFSQVAVGHAQNPDLIYFREHEQKSATIDSAIPDALEAIAQQAAERVFPAARTAEERRARSEAIRQAMQNASTLVEYEIIDGPRSRVGAPGYVRLDGRVSRQALLDLYQRCAGNLNNKPKYKIMLFLDEQIEKEPSPPQPFSDGKTAASISNQLLNAGFQVMNGRQFDSLKSIKGDFARLNGEDARLVLQVAADQGADIIVHGTVTVRGPRVKNMHGRTFYFWAVDGTMHAIWRDSAMELFAIPLPDGIREGAGTASPNAGAARALEKAGLTFASEFVAKMQTVPPRTEVQMELHSCKNASQLAKIVRCLRTSPMVRSVRPSLAQGDVAKIVISTIPDPDVFELVMFLEECNDPKKNDFLIETKQFGPNSILAKMKPN